MTKLYQYAVIFEPTDDEIKAGKKAELVVNITTVLTKDKKSAEVMAGRAIPNEFIDKLDQLTVVVKDF